MSYTDPHLLTVVDFKIPRFEQDSSADTGESQWQCTVDLDLFDKFGASRETCRKQHREGSPAERAISLWIDLPWTGSRNWCRGAGEIGSDIQSRCRLTQDHPDLGFREGDNPNHVYVLVHKPLPYAPQLYRFVGWMYGHQGMQERNIQQRNPNRWFVKPSQLHPILQLPHLQGRQPKGWITRVWLP